MAESWLRSVEDLAGNEESACVERSAPPGLDQVDHWEPVQRAISRARKVSFSE